MTISHLKSHLAHLLVVSTPVLVIHDALPCHGCPRKRAPQQREMGLLNPWCWTRFCPFKPLEWNSTTNTHRICSALVWDSIKIGTPCVSGVRDQCQILAVMPLVQGMSMQGRYRWFISTLGMDSWLNTWRLPSFLGSRCFACDHPISMLLCWVTNPWPWQPNRVRIGVNVSSARPSNFLF